MCWWVGGEGPSRPRAKAASPVLISKLPEREDQKEVGVFHKMLARLRQARGSSRRKSLIHSFVQPENNDRVLSLVPGTVQGHPGVDGRPSLEICTCIPEHPRAGDHWKGSGMFEGAFTWVPGQWTLTGEEGVPWTRGLRGAGEQVADTGRWLTVEGDTVGRGGLLPIGWGLRLPEPGILP